MRQLADSEAELARREGETEQSLAGHEPPLGSRANDDRFEHWDLKHPPAGAGPTHFLGR